MIGFFPFLSYLSCRENSLCQSYIVSTVLVWCTSLFDAYLALVIPSRWISFSIGVGI